MRLQPSLNSLFLCVETERFEERSLGPQ